MEREVWQKIDELFDRYLDADASERATFIEKNCTDPFITSELQKLIDSLEPSTGFIEESAVKPVSLFHQPVENKILTGKTVGAYKLLEVVGSGGMGTVYRASRVSDFTKEVAVKIIPEFGEDTASGEIFRRESQILARLDHENIAKILDGGTTDDGTPFIVMEYVDGVGVSDFCRKNELTLTERLKLFLQILSAVSYAHKNLVVHRDLKPNNIFVKPDGTVKLLDFGIAKIVEPGIESTRTVESRALTPEYASPEQFTGEPITTASDIYSLGVVFYEMICGARPFDFKSKPLREVLDIVQHTTPRLPSEINFDAADADIDAIALKALEKDPANRYASVSSFAEDITFYLSGMPVRAAKNSFFYRTKKLIARHKAEFAASAILFIIFNVLIAAYFYQTAMTAAQAVENRRSAYAAEMILAGKEWESSNLNGVRDILARYVPKDGEEDLRGFEWHFLNSRINPTGKVAAITLPDEVWSIDVSRDGKLIAAACNDNISRVIDFSSGKIIASTPEQKGAWQIKFFPDGKRFAVSGSSNSSPVVKIYSTANRSEITTLTGHAARVRALDISPDGRIIASGSKDGTVKLWDGETGKLLKSANILRKNVSVELYSVSFSGDGKYLVFAGTAVVGKMTVADLSLKIIDADIAFEGGDFWRVTYTPYGKAIIASTFAGDVFYFDADSLKMLKRQRVHKANINGLAISPDGGTLVTGSWDREIKLIRPDANTEFNLLRGHFSGVHDVAFTADGKFLVSASADFSIIIWDAEQTTERRSIENPGSTVVIGSDGKSYWSVAASSYEVKEFEIGALSPKRIVPRPQKGVTAYAFSNKSGRMIYGSTDGEVEIDDVSDGHKINSMKWEAKNMIFAIATNPELPKAYVGSANGTIHEVDLNTGKPEREFAGHADVIKTIVVSNDGKYVLSGSIDKTARLWNAETGETLLTLSDSTKAILSAAISNDNKLVVLGSADDKARVYDARSGELLHELSGASAGIFAVSISPDGSRIVTGSDVGVVRIWDTMTGKQLLAMRASDRQISQLKFSEDGKTLAIADVYGKIELWKNES